MTPQTAVQSLLAADWSEVQIADAVGCNRSTINRLRRGNYSVNYDTGKALVELVGTPAPDKGQDGASKPLARAG